MMFRMLDTFMPGVSFCVFPLMSDRYLGIIFVPEESGSPCLLTILDQFSGRMGVKFRVDRSNYNVPCAMHSSNHAKDVNPSLIRILCRENSFQDLLIQESGCADF